MGDPRVSLPLGSDPHPVALSLHPAALCGQRRGDQDLRPLGRPADPVHGPVSPFAPEEAAEMFPSLVPSLDAPAGGDAAAARDPRAASLLLNMHWSQLYPFLFNQLFLHAETWMCTNKHVMIFNRI